MTQENNPPAAACDEFELLMMRRLDGEITPDEARRLDEHLSVCANCRKTFAQYEKITAAAGHVSHKEPPNEEWDVYWDKVENRLERGIAWTLITIGLSFVIAYAAFIGSFYLVRSRAVSLWVKIAVFVVVAGFALLFTSVAREKLTMRKTDKYKGVKR